MRTLNLQPQAGHFVPCLPFYAGQPQRFSAVRAALEEIRSALLAARFHLVHLSRRAVIRLLSLSVLAPALCRVARKNT